MHQCRIRRVVVPFNKSFQLSIAKTIGSNESKISPFVDADSDKDGHNRGYQCNQNSCKTSTNSRKNTNSFSPIGNSSNTKSDTDQSDIDDIALNLLGLDCTIVTMVPSDHHSFSANRLRKLNRLHQMHRFISIKSSPIKIRSYPLSESDADLVTDLLRSTEATDADCDTGIDTPSIDSSPMFISGTLSASFDRQQANSIKKWRWAGPTTTSTASTPSSSTTASSMNASNRLIPPPKIASAAVLSSVVIGAGTASSALAWMSKPDNRSVKTNSCTLSTLTYSDSTFCNPSLPQCLAAISIILHCQLLRDSEAPRELKQKLPFDEETGSESTKSNESPTVHGIFLFLTHVFDNGLFTAECSLIALIYLNRLTNRTSLALTVSNYRPIYIIALCLAQKMFDDMPLVNFDFQLLYPQLINDNSNSPRGGSAYLRRFNHLEYLFLINLDFELQVASSQYAQYYFECRSIVVENAWNFLELCRLERLVVEEQKSYQLYVEKQKSLFNQLNPFKSTNKIIHLPALTLEELNLHSRQYINQQHKFILV